MTIRTSSKFSNAIKNVEIDNLHNYPILVKIGQPVQLKGDLGNLGNKFRVARDTRCISSKTLK